jgi:fluoroquinolone transport system permease protein
MNALNVIRSLGPIDVRGIRRDNMLFYMAFMPLVLALIMRFGVPLIRDQLLSRTGLDIEPYYFLLMSYFMVMLSSALVGMAIGFLLLDERDNQTLLALQVSPLSMRQYVAYRIIVPVVLASVLVLVAYPIAGLGNLTFWQQVIVALTAALSAPLWMLFLGGFAANKVQGFALVKAAGFIMIFLPMFGYFVTSAWRWAFGVIPTFWPLKIYWLYEAGEPVVWPYILVAVIFQLVLLVLLLRRFMQVIYRQ